MGYSFYELIWFFFLYSFMGWCGEVCVAACKRKKFINRGFVSSPFCPIYGTGAVAFAIFLPELKGNLFFLFLLGTLLAAFIEFITGVVLERIFHRKWWDYSEIRFNFEGYICLRYSLLWGIFAVLLILFVDPFICTVIRMIPGTLGMIFLWALSGILLIDSLGTALTLLGMQKKMKQVSEWSEEIGHISGLLENAITKRITMRMEKSFPSLSERRSEDTAKKEEAVFAKGCGFYKLVCLFFIGAFLGDITETIFCLVTTGVLMSRSSVVYGPFSIVWGIGCALLTLILYRIKDKSDSYIFVTGTLLGGAYEYVCSVFTELLFGTVFWDYSGFMFNLGGRINLLYCLFWGIAAVVWMKLLYPRLSVWIEKLPVKAGTVICNAAIVFMIVNCVISSLALARYTERNTAWVQQSIEERNELEEFLDRHFPDERMEKIYPNAKIVK